MHVVLFNDIHVLFNALNISFREISLLHIKTCSEEQLDFR